MGKAVVIDPAQRLVASIADTNATGLLRLIHDVEDGTMLHLSELEATGDHIYALAQEGTIGRLDAVLLDGWLMPICGPLLILGAGSDSESWITPVIRRHEVERMVSRWLTPLELRAWVYDNADKPSHSAYRRGEDGHVMPIEVLSTVGDTMAPYLLSA